MPKNHSRYTWGQAGADVGHCPQCHRPNVVITEIGLCWKCGRATGNRMTSPWFQPDEVVSEQCTLDAGTLDRLRELEGQ